MAEDCVRGFLEALVKAGQPIPEEGGLRRPLEALIRVPTQRHHHPGRLRLQLAPPVPSIARYAQEELAGTVIFHGDVVGAALPAETWDAERGKLNDRAKIGREDSP